MTCGPGPQIDRPPGGAVFGWSILAGDHVRPVHSHDLGHRRGSRHFGAEVERERSHLYRPRWNIAPTDTHWIVRLDGGIRKMVPARFGFDGPKGQLIINAR